MAEQENEYSKKQGSTNAVGAFLKKNLTDGERAIKHAVGLGAQQQVVPEAEPVLDGPIRAVEVGWHPVGGIAGKWFAEKTGLGKMITDKVNKYPDPTQHWAVLVGDYAHQLWMDESFDVIYTNELVKREEWQTFKVGETRFNDDATRRAGETVIQNIRDKQPGYNLITNNCQTYALQLLDAIKVGTKREFGTTLAVYERIKGPGAVMDLFKDDKDPNHVADSAPDGGSSVGFAQQVMNDNTTQLDTQEQMDKSADKEKEDAKEAVDSNETGGERETEQVKEAGDGEASRDANGNAESGGGDGGLEGKADKAKKGMKKLFGKFMKK